MQLPIHDIREQIVRSLSEANRLVLTAPTGSGKTTQVPQFLLAANLLPRHCPQIVVLQPRRLAARMMARRVAAEMGTTLGDLVGFRTRHESCITGRTLIRFMTEGLFLRMMQANPRLHGIGAVVLDEFHERNLATDVSAALLKLLQERQRPDIRMLVMSATLDVQRISEYLACPALEAHGRTYPVEIRHYSRRVQARVGAVSGRPGQTAVPPWELAAEALEEVLLAGQDGDVLIFMPGVYEIRRTVEACQRLAGRESIAAFPLYSELPAAEQDAALAPCSTRKVIVSTNVAETSITIDGIRHVIDSGLARVNRYDPRRGINVLAIEPISRASADQRAGRAGRTSPGTCIRLWPESEHRHRPAHSTPEVQRVDLAEVVLQLHAFGVAQPREFPWLEAPSPAALDEAETTLSELGALDPGKAPRPSPSLAPMGHTMARLPMHPRLSRMLVESSRRHCLQRAARWAALISERDILIRGARGKWAEGIAEEFPRSDFLVLEAALDAAQRAGFDPARCAAMGIHAIACREVQRTQHLFLEACRAAGLAPDRGRPRDDVQRLAECLLVAFPDHLAIRRSDANLACALAGNRRGQLDPESVARHAGLLLPVEIREIGQAAGSQNARTVLSLVTEISRDWLHDLHPDRIVQEVQTVFNPDTLAVETLDRELFEGLVIEQKPRHQPDREAAAQILAEQVIRGALKLDRWDRAVDQWIERVRCVAQWFPERRMITYDEDERRLILQEVCAGAVRHSQIQDRPVLQHVKDALSWEDQQFVETMAPERYQLPRGGRMKIEYSAGSPPRARARIQDLYGLNQAPIIAAGRAKLLIEILAPSMRPVQMTDDLENFWKNLYPALKKELARKYPRHEWR